MIKRTSTAIAISAFGLALGAGASSAAEQTIACGSPAVPAVYGWVVTQPAVPELSHLEYQWARQTAPAVTKWHWQRTTTTTIYQWKLWVPNTATPQEQWSAASPGAGWENTGESKVVVVTEAVTKQVTEYEFKRWDQKTDSFVDGTSKWRDSPIWNANDANGKPEGWEPTGESRTVTVEVSPAVTETQYLWKQVLPAGEWIYQQSATKPGDGWEQDSVVSTSTKTEDVWSETQPDGDGWTKTAESQTTPATYEYKWAAAKPGDEWSQTDAEPKKVIDVAAVQEQKVWQVIVPAVPAGEPCEEKPPVEPPVEQPPVEKPPVVEGPVVGPVEEQAPGAPQVKPTPKPTPKPASAIPQVNAVKTVTPTRLAYTGSDLTLLWTGLGFVLVGAGLGVGYRRLSREN